jgi:hypothetical protein
MNVAHGMIPVCVEFMHVLLQRPKRLVPKRAIGTTVVRHPLHKGEPWGEALEDLLNAVDTDPAVRVCGYSYICECCIHGPLV